jgi:hypothetical protein
MLTLQHSVQTDSHSSGPVSQSQNCCRASAVDRKHSADMGVRHVLNHITTAPIESQAEAAICVQGYVVKEHCDTY